MAPTSSPFPSTDQRRTKLRRTRAASRLCAAASASDRRWPSPAPVSRCTDVITATRFHRDASAQAVLETTVPHARVRRDTASRTGGLALMTGNVATSVHQGTGSGEGLGRSLALAAAQRQGARDASVGSSTAR